MDATDVHKSGPATAPTQAAPPQPVVDAEPAPAPAPAGGAMDVVAQKPVPVPAPAPAPSAAVADNSQPQPTQNSPLPHLEQPASAPKQPKPAKTKNGVGGAIFATVVIILTLAGMAVYAYLQSPQ